MLKKNKQNIYVLNTRGDTVDKWVGRSTAVCERGQLFYHIRAKHSSVAQKVTQRTTLNKDGERNRLRLQN